MNTMKGKVSKEAMQAAELHRANAENPADFAPGMNDNLSMFDSYGVSDDSGDDLQGKVGDNFGLSSGFGTDFGSGTGFGTDFGSGWGTPNFGQQSQPQEKTFEDTLTEGVKVGAKGFIKGLKELITSFKAFGTLKRMEYGKSLGYTSAVSAVVGLLIWIFGSWLGFQLLIASILSAGTGVFIFLSCYEDVKKAGGADAFQQVQDSSASSSDNAIFDAFANDDAIQDEISNNDGNDWIFGDNEAVSNESVTDMSESADDSVWQELNLESATDFTQSDVKDAKDIVESIPDKMQGYTRQFLYEKFVLEGMQSIKPDFNKFKEIGETTQDFQEWSGVVMQSGELLLNNPKEEDKPYLRSLKENLFYYILDVARSKGIRNPTALMDEIVNIFSYDVEKNKRNKNIYGEVESVGLDWYIKIMKGTTALVGVKDAMKVIEDYVLDVKNYIPVIFGIDPNGDVIKVDMKDVHALLVSGVPRSGKSWFVISILSQMMMFRSPKELNFYIIDRKGKTSDYYSMNMPHIKKFVTDSSEGINLLYDIVRKEGARRSKIIGEAKCVDIWGYKKKYPDADMPLIYVVIDEVIGLVENMTVDEQKEFNSALKELITMCPAYGLRAIIIPHIVKDYVIKKAVTNSIPWRISVGGDAATIEDVTGAKAKDFPHKLIYAGDMAVRQGNKETQFVHNTVLSDTQEGNMAMYDLISAVWTKLEPDSIRGSRYETYKQDLAVQNLLSDCHEADSDSRNASAQSDKVGVSLQDNDDNSSNEINIWG